MRYVKEEAMCNNEHAIDWNSAVEELHALSSQDLNKLLRESENFTIQLNNEKGSMIQIDMEKLAWSLPLHLIAVLVLPGGDDMRLRYMLRGVRLLHSVCDLASRNNTKLEQILLEEAKLTEQILDLVFYMLVVLARYEQENFVGHFVPLLHSALVACSFHLLTGYVSSQWQDLVHVLLAHPKVDIFMDVAFDAVRVDIRFFQSKLSALNNDVWCEKSSLLSAERIAHNLVQQCEASLQFLQSLCQQNLFRERVLKNKELCKNGGILSLARVILNLNIPPHFKESSTIVAAVSRLKSKVLSILLQLCETESISYLDEVASSPRSMHLAKSVVLEVLELLKTAFSGGSKRHNNCFDNTNPKGHVLLNSMRLADIFSDDSNFRSFIMTNITQVLAQIFALPREDFLSSWCSTELPVMEEDATLEYDPFVAAGVVLVSCTGSLGAPLLASNALNETNTVCPFVLNSMPSVSHAQQRTSFLVKIIANLHCFVPNICEEQERHLFLNKFIECLQMEAPKCSSIFSFGSDTQRAAAICENLCSLLNHTGSLTPNLLNEEDVQLLSDFLQKLQALLPPAQFDDNSILESVIKDGNEMQDKKFEASSLEHENSLCWAKYSYRDFCENKHGDTGGSSHDVLRNQSPLPQLAGDDDLQLSEDAQSTGECASSLITKLDATVLEESPEFKQKDGDLKEDISESPTFQEVDQFNAMNDDVMELDRSGRKDKSMTGRIASGSLREVDRVTRNVETSGSDTSAKGKHCLSQILDNEEFPRLTDHMKGNGFRGVIPENEKGEAAQGEEKQPRKRKRNIMNEKQITVIEKALLDEPEMQRNATSLQTWADKLSVHGSELTSSQLKNWLNNRKARLARAAREVRAPSEGENAFPDKACGSSLGHFYDSPESAGEDFYIPPRTSRGGNQNSSKFEMPPTDFVDFAAQHSIQMNCPTLRYPRYQPGQFVSLTDGEGKEVAEGKIYQVDGRWHGKSLEDVGIYVVDVIDLKVDRWMRLQHPSEVVGTTFEEAEAKNGVMRVEWDANKVSLLPL